METQNFKGFNIRVYALCIVNNKLLTLKEPFAGNMVVKLPGGGLEFGEGTADCLKREFKEDAGIEIVPVNRLAILDQDFYTYPNGDRVQPINAFYLVEETSAKHYQPKVTETTTTKYFSLDEEPPRFFNGQHEQMWQILKDFTHNRKDI